MIQAISDRPRRGIGPRRLIQQPTDADWQLVRRIQSEALALGSLSQSQLKTAAQDLRASVQSRNETRHQSHETARHLPTGESVDQTLIRGCSLVSEAVRRVTGKTYFAVQILAGLFLTRGMVAEMRTGEGKTLTSAIPAFNNALLFPSVHVATPNAYLAARDSEELRHVFELLGLSVGLLPEKPDPKVTRDAYRCDVTYGAGYGFGFDFLRDELAARQQPELPLGLRTILNLRGQAPPPTETLQRGLHCSLIDEIDSVLLDEAMTPLILSISSQQPPRDAQLFRLARLLAEQLQPDADFQTQPAVRLTSGGIAQIETALGSPQAVGDGFGSDPAGDLRRPWSVYVENALSAKYVLKADIDFVVRNKSVQIVDQKTGRIFSDRSWRNGLHQAVEEFVGLEIGRDKSSAGRITRQAYYRMYTSLCGMTGTAAGAEPEFLGIYDLPTVRIPQNTTSLRTDLPDRYFGSSDAKFHAVVKEAAQRHARLQPVLIGTRTIADSEELSDRLRIVDVPHVVLNGKQDQQEAEIVALAGCAGRVTVATNMAGRGTDIQLNDRAISVGGLHVIGVERHESRRIDNQLAGRAARAGKPGSCQFFLSSDDALLNDHAVRLSRDWKRRADRSGEIRRNQAAVITRIQRHCEADAYHTRRLMMLADRDLHDLIGTLGRRSRSS